MTPTANRSPAHDRQGHPADEGETKAEDRDDTEYSYPALKLQQNGHVIYYTTIPVDDLFPFCFVVPGD